MVRSVHKWRHERRSLIVDCIVSFLDFVTEPKLERKGLTKKTSHWFVSYPSISGSQRSLLSDTNPEELGDIGLGTK